MSDPDIPYDANEVVASYDYNMSGIVSFDDVVPDADGGALYDPERLAETFERLAKATDAVKVQVMTAEGESGDISKVVVARIAEYPKLGAFTSPLRNGDADD